ncbi:beta-lactamase/transpeptidase-like protein [Flammula alnicola]|nr:beta-lactamase/transpeptidase-like protein [Flammula alnicola]
MVKLTSGGKEALDNLVARVAQEQKIPGFVVGATNIDEEIYFKSGGYKVVNDPTSGKVEEDSIFWICSMTKLIAHIGALQLIEQGKLSVETPVADFFPQFANPIILDDVTSPNPSFTPAKTVVRVKHLLNFSSGLFYPVRTDAGSRMSDVYYGPHDMKDPHSSFFEILKGDLPGIPLKFEPGTDFVYGFSSDVLGFIVEKVSGETLEVYLQENVFQPLGMKASFYLTPDLKEKLLPLAFRKGGKLEPWVDQPGTRIIETDPAKLSCHLGGVGLYVSLKDYLTLLRHLLQIHAGKAHHPILKNESVHSLFVGTSTEEGAKNLDLFINFPNKGHSWSTALAVCNADWPNRRKKGSAFWSGWAGTHFFMDPTTGIAAVYGIQLVSITSGSRDPDNLAVFSEFEETLYAGLA